MAEIDLIMPKMGESIMEATILKWVKKEGDSFELDETILEIATDKVDSEVPAPHAGTLTKILYKEGDVVEVGKTVARYSTQEVQITGNGALEAPVAEPIAISKPSVEPAISQPVEATLTAALSNSTASPIPVTTNGSSNRFYSPLVMNIARNENIGMEELERIPGTGKNNRVSKKDMLSYLKSRNKNGSSAISNAPIINQATNQKEKFSQTQSSQIAMASKTQPSADTANTNKTQNTQQNVEIVEMDRMRKLIADHMVMSKRTSPHVTSFVEADVTNIVQWRNRIKADFQKREGEKITFTPIFMQAVIKAIKDFPGVNVSLEGTNIIYKKDINIGMATALPSGNLIVPVIKNADQYNIVGLTKKVNDLANRARENKLKPDEIQGGTYTLTNVGTFGNVMGTPIINQPQVAILAVGAIRKKPAVIETPEGDAIAIRQMMFMSHSYDHRVVDGFLGGSFVRRVADYLESFDSSIEI